MIWRSRRGCGNEGNISRNMLLPWKPIFFLLQSLSPRGFCHCLGRSVCVAIGRPSGDYLCREALMLFRIMSCDWVYMIGFSHSNKRVMPEWCFNLIEETLSSPFGTSRGMSKPLSLVKARSCHHSIVSSRSPACWGFSHQCHIFPISHCSFPSCHNMPHARYSNAFPARMKMILYSRLGLEIPVDILVPFNVQNIQNQ